MTRAIRRQPTGRLPDAEFDLLIREAKDRHNLSDIIGRHTKLEKRGKREMAGLCCFHSEKTPSLEVNDAKGTYHCWGCGRGGDAITFLVEKEGMQFRDAVEWLLGEELPVVSDEERARRKAADEQLTAARINLARSIWAASVPAEGTPAEVYVRSRGITIDLPPTVRFVMTPRWRNEETGEIGRDHPAMACALQDASGAIVGVQCVFLQDGGRRKYERVRDDGKKAKAKLTFGVIVGSALRLGPVSEQVILTEGPEDGLSLLQSMPTRSVWVSCGTALLSRVDLPAEVKALTLAGDNNDAGRTAVAEAHTVYAERGLAVQEVFPDPAFKDWNDELRGLRI